MCSLSCGERADSLDLHTCQTGLCTSDASSLMTHSQKSLVPACTRTSVTTHLSSDGVNEEQCTAALYGFPD